MAKRFIKADIPKTAFPVSLLFLKDDGVNDRTTVAPGDDITFLPSRDQAQINSHWEALGGISEWDKIAHPPAESITPNDIRGEMHQRLSAVMSNDDRHDSIEQALGILLDMALTPGRRPTPQEEIEVADMRLKWGEARSIRARGKQLEATLPLDFQDDKHWPSHAAFTPGGPKKT